MGIRPVASDWRGVSPALEADFLQVSYGMEIYEVNLTDIMRQSEQSGILYNATRVREMIGAGSFAKLLLRVAGFPDIVRVSGGELLEELDQCYSSFGMDETMVICRSNKRANRFNEGIRARILYREDAFSSGDKVMIVKIITSGERNMTRWILLRTGILPLWRRLGNIRIYTDSILSTLV